MITFSEHTCNAKNKNNETTHTVQDSRLKLTQLQLKRKQNLYSSSTINS